jgi:23S rRNA pseudouridine1911/1915/1917 synthase
VDFYVYFCSQIQAIMRRNSSSATYAASLYNVFTPAKGGELLTFLMEAMPGVSRNKAKAILAGHGVQVNGKLVTQYNFLLEPGMQVRVRKHKRNTELKNRFVKIVFEDKHLVVIEKNIGILSMGTTHHQMCVKKVLDDYFHKTHQKARAHVVHRLDRDTSGLMIYAKTMEAEQILEKNWHDIVYDRRYVAVVSGEMEQKEGTVESWLKDNKAFFTYSSPEDNGGKYAITHYRVVASEPRFSLVELKLETGRKNQIRVHMGDLHHPVCGDVKYGDGNDPLHRLCLHAFRLHFYHPITNEPMEFETPYPTPFRKLFEKAE